MTYRLYSHFNDRNVQTKDIWKLIAIAISREFREILAIAAATHIKKTNINVLFRDGSVIPSEHMILALFHP